MMLKGVVTGIYALYGALDIEDRLSVVIIPPIRIYGPVFLPPYPSFSVG